MKQSIEGKKLKKKEAAELLGVSPQLLQGYFRSERLQDNTKSEIRTKLGIDIEQPLHMNEPKEKYTQQDALLLSLQKEIQYLKEIVDIHTRRLEEKDEIIAILKDQLKKNQSGT